MLAILRKCSTRKICCDTLPVPTQIFADCRAPYFRMQNVAQHCAFVRSLWIPPPVDTKLCNVAQLCAALPRKSIPSFCLFRHICSVALQTTRVFQSSFVFSSLSNIMNGPSNEGRCKWLDKIISRLWYCFKLACSDADFNSVVLVMFIAFIDRDRWNVL